jgi:hypothetical protein
MAGSNPAMTNADRHSAITIAYKRGLGNPT